METKKIDRNDEFFSEKDYEGDRESAEIWFSAQSPNYEQNTNKLYPYTETPAFSSFNLIKVPASLNNLLEHVDYWGEGRVITNSPKQISGFTNCYNVNYQYKVVSVGLDKNRKIPNRIPVTSYTNCDTSSFIKNNSVKLVTVTTPKINKTCAEDIARIVNKDFGKVIILGYENNAKELTYVEQQLRNKDLVYYQGYKLPEIFKELTVINNARSYISVNSLKEQLYHNIKEGSYTNAVEISKALHNNGPKLSITYTLQRLLKEKSKNIMAYAYQLWINGGKKIVMNNLPKSFNHILNQDSVWFFDPMLELYLKLDKNIDYSKKIIAWGDNKTKSSKIFCWHLTVHWEDNSVSFKIINEYHRLYLTLDTEKNVFESRQAQGEAELNEARFLWYLEPVLKNNTIYFLIINRQFKQILNLDSDKKDENGKILWGQEKYHGFDYFRWNILPCNE